MSNLPHGTPKLHPQGPAGPSYTLPGVINYLTSEFTNLERYKILNSLEKSEMKRKINELQGELNSIRYIEERQRAQITLLSKENELLKLKLASKTDKLDSKLDSKSVLDLSPEEEPLDLAELVPKIPEINLLVVKYSREQLNKAMNEIFYLLRTPSPHTFNYLGLDERDASGTTNENSEEPNVLPMSTINRQGNDGAFDELFSGLKDEETELPGLQNKLGKEPNSSFKSSIKTEVKPESDYGFQKYLNDEDDKPSFSKSLSNMTDLDTDLTNKLFGEVMLMESKKNTSNDGRVRGFDDNDIIEGESGGLSDNQSVVSEETVVYEEDEDEFAFNGEEVGFSVSLHNEKYPYVKILDGDDDLIPYLHYRNSSDVQISFFLVVTSHVSFSCKATLIGLPKDVLSILHLFLAVGIHHLIVVYKSGIIEALTNDETHNSLTKSNLLLGEGNQKKIVLSAVICRVESRSLALKNVHRLAVSTEDVLEVYEISTDTSTVEIKEHGKWASDTLLGTRQPVLEELEVIGWRIVRGDDTDDVDDENQMVISMHNEVYSILLQNSGYLIEFALDSETLDIVSSSYAKQEQTGQLKLRFHGNYVVVVIKDHNNSDSYHCTLINLVTNSKKSSKLKFKQLVLLQKGHDCQLVTETRSGLLFYDLNMTRTKEMKKFGALLRVGENLVIKGDKKMQIID